MGLFDNFTPEARLAMAAGVLGGSNIGTGLSQGMQMALPIMSANREEAQQKVLENKTRAWLQQQFPGEDFSTVTPDVMKAYASEALKRRFATPEKAEFKQLDDGTYGSWDGSKFNKLGSAPKQADLPAIADEYNFAKSQGFKGSFDDYQKHKASIDDGKTSDRFKTELDTIKTYRSEDAVKTYTATRDGFEKVRSGAQLDSAQGDISLVYGFMKMLDPTSVVREGEFATAQNSGGIPDTVVNAYNRAISGERLTPDQRKQFVQAAASQYENTVSNLKTVNKRYSDLANEYGVPTDRVLEQPKVYSSEDPLGIR